MRQHVRYGRLLRRAQMMPHACQPLQYAKMDYGTEQFGHRIATQGRPPSPTAPANPFIFDPGFDTNRTQRRPEHGRPCPGSAPYSSLIVPRFSRPVNVGNTWECHFTERV